MILTALGVVAVIGLVMFVHELGHYVTAKRAGVVVEEFGFGFPPRLLRLWRDTSSIYVNNERLLIGRDVKIPKELKSQCWVRYKIGQGRRGRRVITQIEVVDSANAPGAVLVDIFDPGTEYTLNAIPFLAFVRLRGEEDHRLPGSLASASKRVRFAVMFGGPAMNLLLALVLFAVAFMVGWPEPSAYGVLVAQVASDSPAESAGLQVNDVILSIDGQRTEEAEEVIRLTKEQAGQSVTLKVLRQGETLFVDLVPRANPPEGEGAMGAAIVGGWVVEIKPISYPLGQAIVKGTKQTASTIAMVAVVPVQILRGLIPIEQARPAGIVGIARITADAVEQSVDTNWLFPIVQLTAVISIAIGITNLLPIPALDGGRIVFVLLEAIRGKRISPEREGAIHFIGLAVLLTLMLVITYFDITTDIPTVDWRSMLPQ